MSAKTLTLLALALCAVSSHATQLTAIETKASLGLKIKFKICIKFSFGKTVDIDGITHAGHYILASPVCLGDVKLDPVRSRLFKFEITLKITFSFKNSAPKGFPRLKRAKDTTVVFPAGASAVPTIPSGEWIRVIFDDGPGAKCRATKELTEVKAVLQD